MTATTTNRHKGFRLWRAEVMNWGTLGENTIHGADFLGGWVCITGRNGTGKSTLADAITTAFPPAGARIYYNAAGGAKDTKERTRLTYMRGYYGHEKDESGRAKPSTLRSKPGTPTAILLQFHEESSKKWVTLLMLGTFDAQNEERWLYGTLEKKADLSLMQGKEDWDSRAKRLRKEGWSLGSEPSVYRTRLIELLRIPSEKAIKTFVRTVGLKDIGDVNTFIRNHMLEDVSIHERYVELTKHYQKQLEIDAEIQRTINMISLLAPLDNLVPAYQRHEADLTVQKPVEAAVAWRIAEDSSALLESLIKGLDVEAQALDGAMVGTKNAIGLLEESIKTLGASEPAQRAATMTARASLLTERRRLTESNLNQLSVSLKLLRVGLPTNESTFREMRAKLQKVVESTDESAESHGDTLAERKRRGESLRESLIQIRREIDSLRNSASHLPREDIDRRAEIAKAVGVRDTDLPYIGELVDVDPAHNEWRVAMEKLLRTYARRMLVPADRFLAVARYVNSEDFGARVRMERVQAKTTRFSMGSPDANAACRKLKVKPNTPFADWLRNSLESHFDHKCFKDVAEYERCTSAAVTFAGLVKGGRGDYHEKRDDVRVRDVRDYFLGWDNQEKIRSMKAEEFRLEGELVQAVQSVEDQRNSNKSAQEARDISRAILTNLTAYDEINMSAVNTALAELENERRQFAKKDPEAAEVEAKLTELDQQLSNLNTTAETQRNAKALLIADLKRLREDLHAIDEEQADNAPSLEFLTFASAYFTDAMPTEAKGLAKWGRAILARVDSHFERTRDLKSELSLKIQGVMSTYLAKFPTEANSLSATMDAVDAFTARRHELEAEKLHELQERFHKYIEENLALHASQLKVTLKEQIADSEKRIDEINRILATIPWEDAGAVQIKPRKNLQQEIRDFEQLLNTASAPLLNPSKEQSTNAFEAVKQVIAFLEKENVRKLVLDARNWQLFAVEIIDPSEKDPQRRIPYMENTGGLSGGQKNKLSVTLLASALAYQYDIAGTNAVQGTFRTVIIDEAFARLDSENARFALELFRKFDFQLILVHPLDGTVRVAEDYVHGFLLATIRENKFSTLTGIQIEDLRSAIAERDGEREGDDYPSVN